MESFLNSVPCTIGFGNVGFSSCSMHWALQNSKERLLVLYLLAGRSVACVWGLKHSLTGKNSAQVGVSVGSLHRISNSKSRWGIWRSVHSHLLCVIWVLHSRAYVVWGCPQQLSPCTKAEVGRGVPCAVFVFLWYFCYFYLPFFFEDFFFFYRSRKIGERIFLHVFISYLVSFTGTVLTKLCRVPLFNTVCYLGNAEAALNINGSIKDFWKYMVEII